MYSLKQPLKKEAGYSFAHTPVSGRCVVYSKGTSWQRGSPPRALPVHQALSSSDPAAPCGGSPATNRHQPGLPVAAGGHSASRCGPTSAGAGGLSGAAPAGYSLMSRLPRLNKGFEHRCPPPGLSPLAPAPSSLFLKPGPDLLLSTRRRWWLPKDFQCRYLWRTRTKGQRVHVRVLSGH